MGDYFETFYTFTLESVDFENKILFLTNPDFCGPYKFYWLQLEVCRTAEVQL